MKAGPVIAMLLCVMFPVSGECDVWFRSGLHWWRESGRAADDEGPGEGFYHEGKIISAGDRPFEVLKKCGNPAWQDKRTESVVTRFGKNGWKIEELEIEEWFYNFGSRRFTQTLFFHNGKLAAVKAGGYGTDGDYGRLTDDTLRLLRNGDRKAYVLLLCGEPYLRQSHDEIIVIPRCREKPLHVSTKVEEWLYNLGPNRLVRILRFENGALTKIETGEYGM